MKIKAVIFDIGGVLIKDPKYREFWKGIEGNEKLRIDFGNGKITKKEFIKKGAELTKIDKKEFLKKYRKYYWTGKRINLSINEFKKIKIKKYIYSDTNPIHLEYLKKIGKDFFKKSNRNFLDKRKKYSKSFKEILKIIKLKPSEVLFIDDKKIHINTARKLGIKTILFKNTPQLKRELNKNLK